MTEEKLSNIFAKYGEITSVSIPDASKGFGYVCFKTHEEAVKAIEQVNGTNQEGVILNVTRHLKKHELLEQSKNQYQSQK